MKTMGGDEQAFRRSEEFERSVLSYVAAKIRFLVRGLLLSISVMVLSILLHWLWPVSEWNVSGNMAGLGLGGFFFVALSAFHVKRVKCPLCSRKTELRSRFTGFGGDEETIIICRSCKVQCPTGMVSD
ncbi:hypothetical protein [Prosthecobacter fluviatilis]|uniref:4Fe-4S ferredoxin-type domain-containing protein n=1 Tax=Prosthecobacter fluviatilis TaxID=445931 RepID=A0ABW0KRJ5_9BACT